MSEEWEELEKFENNEFTTVYAKVVDFLNKSSLSKEDIIKLINRLKQQKEKK